jgi:hypothetical protein
MFRKATEEAMGTWRGYGKEDRRVRTHPCTELREADIQTHFAIKFKLYVQGENVQQTI